MVIQLITSGSLGKALIEHPVQLSVQPLHLGGNRIKAHRQVTALPQIQPRLQGKGVHHLAINFIYICHNNLHSVLTAQIVSRSPSATPPANSPPR